MNRLFFILFIAVVALDSCSKEVPQMSKEEMRKKTDSLVAASRQESDNHAKRDLEHRLKIEVKVKVDSILDVRQRMAKGDTPQALNRPVPPPPGLLPDPRRK